MKSYLLAGLAAASVGLMTTPAQAQTSVSISVGTGGYGDGDGYGDYYDPYAESYSQPVYYGDDYGNDDDAYDRDDDSYSYGYVAQPYANYDYGYPYQLARPSRSDYRYSRERRNQRCGDGTTGAIVGAAAGAIIGHSVGRGDGYYSNGDGTVGAVIGGAAGALVGREIGRSC